jgi:predicted unusual protein kinase regulating ubiquinone biosynthesis (AarF/ABC1/UbiB family)
LVARIKARVGGTGKKRRPRKDAFDRELRGEFDKTKLENFFKRRPGQVAARLAAVLRVAARMIRLWKKEDSLPPEERTRSDRLRAALSGLGPVFVKIGQTLSQRPDLIGEEAADALKSLQMQNAPFPDDVAYGTIAEVRYFLFSYGKLD